MCNLFKNVIQWTCDEAVEKCPWLLKYIPDCYKIKRTSIRVVEKDPVTLGHVPDHPKTQEMCEKLLMKTHGSCMLSLIILKQKKCVPRPLKKWPMAAEAYSWSSQNTRNVWRCNEIPPLFFAECSRLVCETSKNKKMAWLCLQWWRA